MKDRSLTFKLNLLKNQGNFSYNVDQFLLKNDGSAYESFFNILKNKPQGQKLIRENIILSYDNLWSVHEYQLPKLAPVKTLIWNLLLLKENVSLINTFLKQRQKIELLTLNAKYNEALENLKTLEEICGVSLWSLEVKLLLEKLAEKEKIEEISNNSVQIIIDLLKIKIDNREQGVRYQKKMREIISRTTESDNLKWYLSYKMQIDFELNVEIVQGLLLYESINSIIDIFLVTQYVILNFSEFFCKNKYLKKALVDFSELLEDKSLKLVNARIWEYDVAKNSKYLSIISSFENEKFDEVVREFELNKETYISKIHLVYLYNISLFMIGEKYKEMENGDGVGDQLKKRIYLFLSDDNVKDSNNAIEIETIARVFGVFCFSKELKYLFDKFFNPTIINPLSIMVNEDIIEFVDAYSTSTNKLLNVYYNNREDYSLEEVNESLKIEETKLSIQAQKYIDMINTYMQYYYYVNKEQYEEALNVLIKKFVVWSEIVGGLDITNISKWLNSIRYEYNVSIQKLIYIDLVDDFRDLRTSAFLNFLDYHHISAPLEILNLDCIEENLKLYYLEKICRMENLAQLYYLFEQSDEVEDYRIKICKKLLDLTEGDTRKEIEEEINIIYRQRIKRQKLTELDEGKLSVDFEAVRMATRKNLAELFHLYNNIPENEYEIRQGQDLIQTELQELQELMNRIGVKTIEYVSKRASIAKEMYEIYLKEFCFGKNGIDIYLSTRIRHGAFSNQILKVFSAHNIVKDRFSGINSTKKEELLTLYLEIEDIINDIIQKKLKVNYEESKTSAIFNFYEGKTVFFEALNNSIKKACITVDDCTLAFEEMVTEKTNCFLRYIRTELLIEVKNKLSEVLESLLVKAKDIIDPIEYISLEKDINDCNLELKETIEKISSWFVISRDRAWPDFSFNELIDLCNEIGKSLHLNFEKAKINCSIDKEYLIKGKYYKDLNDIFIIFQNNAFTHSAFKSNTRLLNIDIDIFTNESNALEIVFKNNLNLKEVKPEEIDLNIQKINDYYSNASFSDLHLHKEGGTGLFRTINILFSILKIGAGFNVVRHKDTFEVHILLKKSEVLNEKNIID